MRIATGSFGRHVLTLIGGSALAQLLPLLATPFLMLFSQLGRPGTQTLFIAGVFLSNVLLNLALIPWLGLYGAALATALSFLVLAGLLTWLARRTFDVVL